jgi:hypothetical protein
MATTKDGEKRSVSSLGELSQNVAPPRDLWPSIASQIAMNDSLVPAAIERTRLRPTGMRWAALAAVIFALAVGIWLGHSVLPPVGAKSAGVVASSGPQSQPREGRHGVPGTPTGSTTVGRDTEGVDAGGRANNGTVANSGAAASDGAPSGTPSADPNALTAQQVLPASLVTDPRYTMQRAALIRGLEAQLKTLPLDTQHKVASSLATIRTSIKDLQEALGRDPANALLQELLVNSYQDEMRVLTAVHEAGGASGGI